MVFEPDGRVQEIIVSKLKLLHDAQAVGESLFRAHAVGGFRQREDAVALHGIAVQQGQRRREGESVERGDPIGLRLFLATGGDGFRILHKFD